MAFGEPSAEGYAWHATFVVVACRWGKRCRPTCRCFTHVRSLEGQLSGDETGYSRSPVFFVGHYRADEGYDRRPVLVETRGLDPDDPDAERAPRLPLLDPFRPGVDGVALEDGVGQPDFVPAEVGEEVLGDIGYALPGHRSQGQRGVYDGLPELGLRGVVVVKVDRYALSKIQNLIASGCGIQSGIQRKRL